MKSLTTRSKGPAGLHLKIAHLTDIHTAEAGRREEKMLPLVEAERPDLIAITGDSINVTADYEGLRDVLRRVHAPLGVWVVRGNHEDWWPVDNESDYYKSAGVRLLVNSSARVCDNAWLIGLDDQFGGSPDLDKSLAGVPESALKVALFHSPAFFDSTEGRCNVALSGHSHGGQV